MIKRIGLRAFEQANIFRKPAHYKIILRDLFGRVSQVHSDREHLQAAMDWLCRAQDVTRCGGVSGGYFFKRGWMPPYPETTGYIIPTFLRCASLYNEEVYLERALKMGDWEIDIQLSSGAVRGGMGLREYPIVFNTGQVIMGWTALYQATRMSRFMEAATKAAEWLLSIQDRDGKWSKYTYMSRPHAYHTRVAWALIQLFACTGDEKYKTAARRQISWTIDQATENGWIGQMGFDLEDPPSTHTIAYTLRGLLETSSLLDPAIAQEIVCIVQKAGVSLIAQYESRRQRANAPSEEYLPATFSRGWRSEDCYSCLTGNAQLAIVFLKLYHLNRDPQFSDTALRLIQQTLATQSITDIHPGIKGAVAGSYPIWGQYVPYAYLNWATKFLVDALVLKQEMLEAGEPEAGDA